MSSPQVPRSFGQLTAQVARFRKVAALAEEEAQLGMSKVAGSMGEALRARVPASRAEEMANELRERYEVVATAARELNGAAHHLGDLIDDLAQEAKHARKPESGGFQL